MRDAQGDEHTVQVTAQSLYEAVAQGLRIFREHDWSEDPPCDGRHSMVRH